MFDALEASPRFDDSRVVFTELDHIDGTLADHPRFADAFDNMPAEAVMALFVDLGGFSDGEPAPGNDPDFSVFSMVYGTDGTGTIRLLVDDHEPGTGW